MRSRTAVSIIVYATTLASSGAAMAESVRIQDFSSVKIHSDESGSVTSVEERRMEEHSVSQASDASLRVQSDDAGTVIRSESFRRATCYALPGGESNCTEEIRGEGSLTGSTRATFNGRNWWSEWSKHARQVASETAEDGVENTLSRTELRLVRRICSRVDHDERAACLEDALEGEGSTMRLRLRDWIRRP